MADLESLARQGRSKDHRSTSPHPAPSPSGPSTEERSRTRRALLNATAAGLVVPFFLLVGATAAVGAVGFVFEGSQRGFGAGAAAGIFLGAFLAYGVFWPLAYRREVAWLKAQPFRFEVDRYLRALGKTRDATRVEVRAEFEEPLPPDARSLVRQAGEGMHPDAKARLDDGALVLKATIRTRIERRPGSSSHDGDRHANHLIHAFVRAIFTDGLPILHERHPIARVRVKLEKA